MADKGFHITVAGPAGTNFTSFSSSDIEEGDLKKILLSRVRERCAISSKLFFTVNGKSPVADGITLEYYMSLTKEGTEILRYGNSPPPPFPTPKKEEEKPKEGEKLEEGRKLKEDEKPQEGEKKEAVAAPPSRPATNIASFTISVAGKEAVTEPLLPLPARNEALAELAESLGKGNITPGQLPTFADRDMVSLTKDFAVQAGKNYTHPSNMSETNWNVVLVNNRVLYGYTFDFKTSRLKKARKRAFKLKPRASQYDEPDDVVVKPAVEKADDKKEGDKKVVAAPPALGPIPPFYVNDNASVNVSEIRNQTQSSLTKQGFNSRAISLSLGAGPQGVAGSAEASWAQESGEIKQETLKQDVQELIVTYNFPRVVLELDCDCLELTQECRRDAMSVSSKDDVAQFYRNYGNIFVSNVSLGGYLTSTRNVSSTERASLDQIKNTTRESAGLSIQTPKISGGVNYAQTSTDQTDKGSASLSQSVQLAWNATGGDTVLCSNPPAWASTVKDFNYWRVMDQQQIVSIEGLIRDMDIAVWHKLENPTEVGPDPNAGKPSLKDTAIANKAREIIGLAAMERDKSALIAQMQKYYQDNRFDTQAGNDKVNKLLRETFPGDATILLTQGLGFRSLSFDQTIGFGLYMTAEGQLKLF